LESKKSKTQKIIGWAIFIPIFSFMVFFIILHTAFSDKAINVMGFKFYNLANTKSMEPDLKHNDLIVVKKFDFNKLAVGDIVSFKSTIDGNTITVTHKIVEQVDGGFRTKGTNPNAKVDPNILTKDNYIGKFAWSSPFLGKIFAFTKSVPGIITICVNAITLIAIIYLLKRPTTQKAKIAKSQGADTRTRQCTQYRIEVQ